MEPQWIVDTINFANKFLQSILRLPPVDYRSSLFTLGRIDASITLLSLNRSLRHYDMGSGRNAFAKI